MWGGLREEHRTFNRCVGEAVKNLLMEVCLDGGDLFLLSGFQTNCSTKWFEEESWLVHLW